MKSIFFSLFCLSAVGVWATEFEWAPAQPTLDLRLAVDTCMPKQFVLTHNESEFYQLQLNHEDIKNIHRLVKTIATKGWYKLLPKRWEMERLGDKIKATVHPLRFLACILTDQERKQYLYDIRDYSVFGAHVKWGPFKEGLFNHMAYLNERNRLLPYIPGFAKEIGVNSDLLYDYVNRKKWNEFLEYIMS